MPMPKKTQVALNRGRRKAGLKQIRFGAKKKKKQKGDLSEKNYVQHLRKKLGEKSVVFRTGINADEGVPDIMAYSHGKISFYEIKPAISYGDGVTDQFLKDTQEKWIRENCLENKIKAYIVFYLGGDQKVRLKFDYYSKQLTKQNLKKYSRSSSISSRDRVIDKMVGDSISGKIEFGRPGIDF
jgi:hypothetical protein